MMTLFEQDLKNRQDAEHLLGKQIYITSKACIIWAESQLQEFISDKDYREYIHASIEVAAAIRCGIVASEQGYDDTLIKAYLINLNLTRRMYDLLKTVIVDKMNEIVQKKFEDPSFVKEYTRYSGNFGPKLW